MLWYPACVHPISPQHTYTTTAMHPKRRTYHGMLPIAYQNNKIPDEHAGSAKPGRYGCLNGFCTLVSHASSGAADQLQRVRDSQRSEPFII